MRIIKSFCDAFLLFKYSVKIGKERGFKKGRFFFLKSLLFPIASVKWLKFTDIFFARIGFGLAPWDVVATPLRLCLSNNFNVNKRSKIMESHYKILEQKFDKKSLLLLLEGKKVEIAAISGKSGNVYRLSICYSMIWRREGLLTIFIRSDVDSCATIATLTFTIFKNSERNNSLLIGGLQGVRSNVIQDRKELTVKATRDLNGLRPKSAVLNCVYVIAQLFDVGEIIAVSSRNHPVKSTNKRRGRHFQADYDSFWQESKGVLRKDGNFSLPLLLHKRSFDEVSSKKKKDWMARYEHVDSICAMTKEKISSMFDSAQSVF